MKLEGRRPVYGIHDLLGDVRNWITLSKREVTIAQRICENYLPPIFQSMAAYPDKKAHFHHANSATVTLIQFSYNRLAGRSHPEWAMELQARFSGNRYERDRVEFQRAITWLLLDSIIGCGVAPGHITASAWCSLPIHNNPLMAVSDILTWSKLTDWEKTRGYAD